MTQPISWLIDNHVHHESSWLKFISQGFLTSPVKCINESVQAKLFQKTKYKGFPVSAVSISVVPGIVQFPKLLKTELNNAI